MVKCQFLLLLVAGATLSIAQTAPCGRNVVAFSGSSKEDRFLPAPAEHVKACVLRALPVVASRLSKENGLSLEAKTDMALWRSVQQRREDSGVGMWGRSKYARPAGMGTFYVSMEPSSEDNIAGTRLRIEFRISRMRSTAAATSAVATPLMEEVACLTQILTPGDPLKSPRGPETDAAPVEATTVNVPEGVTVKLLLREFLYSREIKKQQMPGPIPFEVAENVKVDGATVIRRGALGIGRFISTKAAGGRGQSGELQFVLEEVTAVDGQKLGLAGAMDRSRGSRVDLGFRVEQYVIVNSEQAARDRMAKVGFPIPGIEAVARAGTGYEAQIAVDSRVQIGR